MNFQMLKVTSLFFTPHDEGWVKTRGLEKKRFLSLQRAFS